ncbi:MAG: hypothetical protein SEPTF4163_006570 [Sporothrix epigloea]
MAELMPTNNMREEDCGGGSESIGIHEADTIQVFTHRLIASASRALDIAGAIYTKTSSGYGRARTRRVPSSSLPATNTVGFSCRSPDSQKTHLINDDSVKESLSAYNKYLARDRQKWADLSFFTFLTKINFSKQPWRYRQASAKDRVLRYTPKYKLSEQKEDFCRVQLTLYHPHYHHDQLILVESVAFETYADAYKYCCEVHTYEDDYFGATANRHEEEFEDFSDDEEEATDEANPIPWDELARELPQQGPETEDGDVLGNRPQDLSKDWGSHVGTYPGWVDNKLWKETRLNHPLGFDVGDFPEGAENNLSDHQRLIYDMVMEHDHHIANGESPAPLRLNIDGRGGSGKSYVVKLFSAHIYKRALL